MTFSRRSLLLAGAGLGLIAPALASCGPSDGGSAANAQNGGGTGSGAGAGDGSAAGAPPVSPPGGGGSPAARIRYDVASTQGQAMLKIYAGAVATMMARPEGDPLNWSFQWYSHWVKGALDASGKASEIARIYGSVPSAAHSLALKMWDGCQAHGANEDEDFFLPWHRMFVWAFENIIRAVSGEAAFTLPYWDYTDASEFAIPPQFRMENDATFGALYRDTRNPGVNAGQPIADQNSLNLSILSEQSYSANGGDAGFCQGLDNGLHGAVHVSVGNSTDGMGVVPWAANDPIFWLHHCNIDRIWASWNAAGNANPTDPAFLSKPFPFADPSGAEVDYVVSAFLDIGGGRLQLRRACGRYQGAGAGSGPRHIHGRDDAGGLEAHRGAERPGVNGAASGSVRAGAGDRACYADAAALAPAHRANAAQGRAAGDPCLLRTCGARRRRGAGGAGAGGHRASKQRPARCSPWSPPLRV